MDKEDIRTFITYINNFTVRNSPYCNNFIYKLHYRLDISEKDIGDFEFAIMNKPLRNTIVISIIDKIRKCRKILSGGEYIYDISNTSIIC